MKLLNKTFCFLNDGFLQKKKEGERESENTNAKNLLSFNTHHDSIFSGDM